MIVTCENERLYLNNWNYNQCRLVSALAQIVKNHNGKVKPQKTAIISNRNTDSEPIIVTHTSYISFTLDNFFYYLQLDDNPFFDFHYQKTGIINSKRHRCIYLDKLTKDWLYDCFTASDCCDADIKEGANLIFNILCNAKESKKYIEKQKNKVPNLFDGGYHYETKAVNELVKIDF